MSGADPLVRVADARVFLLAHELVKHAIEGGELIDDLQGAIEAAKAGNVGGAMLAFAAFVRLVANACIEPAVEVHAGKVTLSGDFSNAKIVGDLAGLAKRESGP